MADKLSDPFASMHDDKSQQQQQPQAQREQTRKTPEPPRRGSPLQFQQISPSSSIDLSSSDIFNKSYNHFVPSRSVSPFEVPTPSIDHQLNIADNTQNDLIVATAQNPAAVMELDLDCNVKFVSKSWESIVGTKIRKIIHKSINDIIIGEVEDKQIFHKATSIMMTDDESYRVKFLVPTNLIKDQLHNTDDEDEETHSNQDSDNITFGEHHDDADSIQHDLHTLQSDGDVDGEGSIVRSIEGSEPTGAEVLDRIDAEGDTESVSIHTSTSTLSTDGGFIELEAQGILIHDSKTKKPSHSMWIVKPWVPLKDLTLELPEELMMNLGFGLNLFESYLLHLTDLGIIDEENLPPPPQELCRICEQMVPNWWLEKHTELCLVEHRTEDTVKLKQENLNEQKILIQNILDTLTRHQLQSAQNSPPLSSNSSISSTSSSSSSSSSSTSVVSVSDYKGLPIPLSSGTLDSVSLKRRKSVSSILPSKRFPIKNIDMLLQYCDEALKINPGEIKNEEKDDDEEYVVSYSPDSARALKNLSELVVPESSDPAIKLLTDDTEDLANQKIESLDRYAHTLQYVDKITKETDEMVLKMVKETITKIKDQVYMHSEHEHDDTVSGNENSPYDSIHQPIAIQSPRPANKIGSSIIFDNGYLDSMSIPNPTSSNHGSMTKTLTLGYSTGNSSPGSMTPKSGAGSDSRSTPIINIAAEDINRTLNRSSSPSNYNSPRRPLSPAFSIPLSSIQRNTKSNIKNSGAQSVAVNNNPGSGANTPISSPLFLTSDVPSSSSSNLDKPQLSPLLVPQTMKTSIPSIKDYEVIKPISKGAFGSVFLTKRKLTGEYFAIKVLKKADMVAKNQVTNVKAERAIMMAQANSPYVVQLVATFQSTNYLYLVMEYLNGGDLATLLKNMGYLPEVWAKRYIAEVIVGVVDLHSKGIVHRDLKPDNLLIDHNGHVKLTDFGLSRMGLVRRQNQVALELSQEPIEDPFTNTLNTSLVASHQHTKSSSLSSQSGNRRALSVTPFALSPGSPLVAPNTGSISSSIFDDLDSPIPDTKHRTLSNPSSGSASPLLRPMTRRTSAQASFMISKEDPRLQQSEITDYALFNPQNSAETRKFVGTPDYLAPETVAGLGQDEASDWWSIGCILFEFIFGYPPFSADSPKEVFENILHGSIQWPKIPPEEFRELCSDRAKDLIDRWLVKDPTKRLGTEGSKQIMEHPYFNGINWETLFNEEASFVPVSNDPESTDYFDDRGAKLNMFPRDDSSDDEDNTNGEDDSAVGDDDDDDDESTAILDDPPSSSGGKRSGIPLTPGGFMRSGSSSSSATLDSPRPSFSSKSNNLLMQPPLQFSMKERRGSRLNDSGGSSEFGSFQFRNLAVLEKQNKDAINRLRNEHLEHRNSMSSTTSSEGGYFGPNMSSGSSSGVTPMLNTNSTGSSSQGIGITFGSSPGTPSGSTPLSTRPRGLSLNAQLSTPFKRSSSPNIFKDKEHQYLHHFSTPTITSPTQLPSHLQHAQTFPSPMQLTTAQQQQTQQQQQLPKSPTIPFIPSPILRNISLASELPDELLFQHQQHALQLQQIQAIRHGSPAPRSNKKPGSGDSSSNQALRILNKSMGGKTITDFSPSSSDTEEKSAISRIRKRRSSRKLSERHSSSSMATEAAHAIKQMVINYFDVLLCEPIPIHRFSIERNLNKLGCDVVSVSGGSAMIKRCTGTIKFDLIFTSTELHKLDCVDLVKLIRNTSSVNSNTFVVALTSFYQDAVNSGVFDSVIEYPVTMEKLKIVLDEFRSRKRKEEEAIVTDTE